MSAANETTHLAIMKRLYPENRIETMMYDNNPLFAMLSKKYDSKGEAWHRAIRYTPTAGRSKTYGVAKANKSPSNVVKVLITTVEDYSLYSVNGKAIRSATGSGALVDIFSEEVDAAMDAMNRAFARAVYGNGGGSIGRLSSGTTLSSTTGTLATTDDIVNFEKGMWLEFASTDGTSGSVLSGRCLVTSVDRDAGTFTVDTAFSTAISGIAASAYIFPQGDFGLAMKGLDAWVPSSAPTPGDSFFGLDRSVDATRLAGVRVSAANYSIAEACKKGLQVGFRNGSKTSHIFMNDRRFLELDLELGSNKRWVDTTKAEVGFTGIEFVGHGGKPVEVYPDPNCPVNTIYGLNLDDWTIEGPTKFPFIEAYDGQKVVREASDDAFAGEIKSYHQMVCRSPGRQWRAALV